jgi:hypothetical protein
MKRLIASAVAVLVVAFSMFAAAPASAHPDHWITIPPPFDFFARAMYTDQHTVVCNDIEQGTYAVVHFRNSANGPVHHTGTVGSGCLWEYHPLLYTFRVCHNTAGCSAWHRGA